MHSMVTSLRLMLAITHSGVVNSNIDHSGHSTLDTDLLALNLLGDVMKEGTECEPKLMEMLRKHLNLDP